MVYGAGGTEDVIWKSMFEELEEKETLGEIWGLV